MNKCKDCNYFVTKNHEGLCYRYPPRILAANSRGTFGRCFHPSVNRNDFCGEFKPKDKNGETNDPTKNEKKRNGQRLEDESSPPERRGEPDTVTGSNIGGEFQEVQEEVQEEGLPSPSSQDPEKESRRKKVQEED